MTKVKVRCNTNTLCNPHMHLIAYVPHTCVSTKFSAAIFHTHIYSWYITTGPLHSKSREFITALLYFSSHCMLHMKRQLVSNNVSIHSINDLFKLIAKASFYEICSSSAKNLEPTTPLQEAKLWPALLDEAEAQEGEVLKCSLENGQQVMWVLTAYGQASSSSSGPRPST